MKLKKNKRTPISKKKTNQPPPLPLPNTTDYKITSLQSISWE